VKGLWAGLVDWLDDRTGFRKLRHHALEEPLPAGTGWWFTLGSVLLFGLSVQVLTGIGLALFYAPTPDHAWDSVRYITTGVRGGAFCEGCITGAPVLSSWPRWFIWRASCSSAATESHARPTGSSA
jgi:hypothetical protein